MKDYSNYHNINLIDKKVHDGKKIFEVSKIGMSGYSALVDGIATTVVIHQSSNPLNEDREDRVLKCDMDIIIKKGSMIELENDTYIVVTDIDNNRIYQNCKIIKTNYKLKWVDKEGNLNIVPCTISDKMPYGVIKNMDTFLELSGRLNIVLPCNNATNTIERGSRFVIDGKGWVVTNYNRITGLLKLIVKEVITDKIRDDLDNDIANANEIENYSINIVNGNDVNISNEQSYKLLIEVFKGKTLVDNPQLTYSCSDETIATVNNGEIQGLQVGSVVIDIGFKDVTQSVKVNISEKITYDYKAIINGENDIRTGRQETYTCLFTSNGEEIFDNSEWWITDKHNNDTDLAFVKSINNNKCIVEATKQFKFGEIILHVKSGTGLMETTKEIQVKSLFSQ